MKMNQGLLITFEGIDGCGKTTQVQRLFEKLTDLGRPCVKVREPGGTKMGEAVRALLKDKSLSDMVPEAELLLFSACRAQIVQKVIKPALKENKIVICDRFYDSTMAYQGYGRQIRLATVEAVIQAAVDFVPDLTFYLDVPTNVAQKRRSEDRDRIELAGTAFYNRVIDGYRELSRVHAGRIRTIDGTKPADDVEQMIWTYLKSALPA